MSQFSFTLHVAGISLDGEYEDVLYEAGCDDALVSVVNGELLVDFDREAPSLDAAISDAAGNIRDAGGQVIGVNSISK